jgi:integrase
MMRYIFNLTIKWEVPGIKSNPCKGVPMLEENNKMERYLSVEEAQRLYESVCQSENTMLKYIVPMLILTGARKREVLDAKWTDFDLSRRAWRIPITKSGRARHVPLSDGALTLLATMPRKSDCEWAFANPETGKPFVSVFYSWNTARKSVGLSDVRMHDLRHSFASLLINSGRTLYEVQHILGHTQVKTTQRYAHLSQDTLLAAANSATAALGAAMMPPVMMAPVSALPAALQA